LNFQKLNCVIFDESFQRKEQLDRKNYRVTALAALAALAAAKKAIFLFAAAAAKAAN